MNQNDLKKQVGIKAASYIEDNMIVGLGTGSTVHYLVEALGERIKNENLNIIGVPTSNRTKKQANSLGIITKNVDEVDHIDLTIDGADQIDENFQGIKGGGAAHLWEKIVAINSDKNMWIVDESKMSPNLGVFPLPVEVIPFGSTHVIEKLDKLGYKPTLRLNEDNTPTLTDFKNYIIDLHFDTTITKPHELASQLSQMVGVVEHGLFLDLVNTVIIGKKNGPQVIENIR